MNETRYAWTPVALEAPFAPRDGAGALVYQDRMWLIGGWNQVASASRGLGAPAFLQPAFRDRAAGWSEEADERAEAELLSMLEGGSAGAAGGAAAEEGGAAAGSGAGSASAAGR